MMIETDMSKRRYRWDGWRGQTAPACVLLVAALVGVGMPSILASSPLYTYNITCPDGWQKVMNNCYLFNLQAELTWDQARTECSLQNADLMVIRNTEELNWINIQTEAYKTDAWWVGLHYRTDWDWVQYGGNKALINWRNEPDNYDEQDCCAINEFGLFSDEFCRSTLGFICKYNIQRGELCPFDNRDDWFMTDTACYYISPLLNTSLHLNWTQARQYCDNLKPDKGSHLMALTTYDDMRSMKLMLSSFNKNVLLPWWTGLTDLQTEGVYVWADGTLANGTLITWDTAPSSDGSLRQDCGVMYQGGSIDDVSCSKRAHYVCERSAFQGHMNLGCGSWLRAGQSCYLLGKGKGVTWSDATSNCARANSHLLQVDNIDEKVWVEDLDLGPIGYWTGLTRAANQYGWAWSDSTVASDTFVKWSREPNNNGGQENCVEIHRDGLYNDRMCSAKTGYICEYPLVYGTACIEGWMQCEQSCYYFSPPNDTFSVTWYEAKQKCMDLVSGRDLSASRLGVNDMKEQACVNKQLLTQPPGAPGYWTDLNDLELGGLWRYSEQVNNPPNNDVITWAKEPNNADGNESCAVVYNGGYYNDLNCAAKAFYICEQPTISALSSAAARMVKMSSLFTFCSILSFSVYF